MSKIPGLAIAIMGKKKPDGEEGPKEDNGASEDIARELLDAIKADDPKAFAESLKSFLDVC